MRYLYTLLFAALSLSAIGQVEYPYPYNPDVDNNGFIGNNDLLELLSLYSNEFNAGVLATDSTSAIYYTGNMDYWDCTSSCLGLEGNWKVLDHYLVGTYKSDIYDLVVSDNVDDDSWVDHKEINGAGVVGKLSWQGLNEQSDSQILYLEESRTGDSGSCFCQTRTSFFLE